MNLLSRDLRGRAQCLHARSTTGGAFAAGRGSTLGSEGLLNCSFDGGGADGAGLVRFEVFVGICLYSSGWSAR